MSVWNGHYACTCYHPLFVFNQFGDLERCALRPGNVHSADGWDGVLKPVVAPSSRVSISALTQRSPCRRSTSSWKPSGSNILAGSAPSSPHDDDRLRFPPTSPARNSKTGKKESTGRRLNRPCRPCATPSPNSSLGYHRNDARIAESGFATSSGVSKSAKVVLAQRLRMLHPPWLADRKASRRRTVSRRRRPS